MSDDRVKQSLAAAHAQEFVEKLEDGYNTVIGERGVGLSGGQKQRLEYRQGIGKRCKNPDSGRFHLRTRYGDGV